jgi:N-acetylmuramoyl-L-alanine amidase
VKRTSCVALSVFAALLMGTASALEYRVKSGDSLSLIAERFGTTVDAIRAANGLTGNLIHPGQKLEIPVASVTHTVVSGESLWMIALKYRVTSTEIMRANGLASDVIQPGQRLTIPSPPASEAPATDVHVTVTANTVHHLSQADIEILARIVKGECPADTPREGKVAVAAVVLNRLERPGYPKTVRGVAHQPLQFSCYNIDVRHYLYNGPVPQWAYEAARAAAAGEDPSRGATHYFNPYLVRPSWANGMKFLRRIGTSANDTHDFYK